jgi:HAD superfamily hydrolase (TIGR01509 family)
VIKHIIFDCDGVLVDSETLSMRADVSLLKRHGIIITEHEAHRRFVGKTFEAMLDEMAMESGVIFPPGLSQQKDRLLEEMFQSDLQIVTGVVTVLRELENRGLTFSVASNSPKARVALALQLTNITGHFASISTFEDVDNGKPAPDVYLRAVAVSGFTPEQCVAVEDSTTGVKSAVAANLKTFAFTGTHHDPHHHAKTLVALGADRAFETMSELPGLI